jgi:hypothetical protein
MALQMQLCEIRESPGKGLGVFATKLIKPGTLVFKETPLIYIENKDYTEDVIEAEFDKLNSSEQVAFMNLTSAHGFANAIYGWSGVAPTSAAATSGRSVLSIYQTNAMELFWGEEKATSGVFDKISRINHSCVPNTFFCWNYTLGKSGMGTVYAIKEIAEGEELLTAYCEPFISSSERAKLLRPWGFNCTCPACEDKTANIQAASTEKPSNTMNPQDETTKLSSKSDDRRCEIMKLNRLLNWYENQIAIDLTDSFDPVAASKRVCFLMTEEGIADVNLAEA